MSVHTAEIRKVLNLEARQESRDNKGGVSIGDHIGQMI